MKRFFLALVCFCLVLPLFAQSRDDVKVYIPPVSGGVPEQQMFFAENFAMELIGANYAVVGSQSESDYSMNLSITQEVEDSYDDVTGVTVAGQIINILTVSLQDSEDGREILQFSWAFETLEEMYEWNLHLIYQAMANVPLTKLTGVPDTNHWRNKWIYIRASFDYPITFYANPTPSAIHESIESYQAKGGAAGTAPPHDVLDHKVLPFPGVTLGAEFQFLNWMSVEGGFQINFGDPISTSLIPSINVALKFPLKPSKHFMIEPYGMGTFPASTVSDTLKFPKLGVGGGIQFGVKGGSRGAFFVDVNYVHYLGEVVTKNNDPVKTVPNTIKWSRFSVGLGIGYKVGFFNRNKDDIPPAASLSPLEEEEY
jgi:hypothetical protein